MSEAAGGQAAGGAPARALPIAGAHERAGALMRELEGWGVPAHYGDAAAEYEAVRGGSGAGLFDLSARGRVEVAGAEAVQFLNGMLTNDVAKLVDGAWMHAAFPNVQGRLVASARVLRRGESFLFDTEPATGEKVFRALERFTLAGDFRVRDLTDETVMLSVQGARAAEVVGAVLGARAAGAAHGRALAETAGPAQAAVMRATHTEEDGFDLIAGAADAEALWGALAAAGARPAGQDALEVLRVEAGVPRYGVDVSEANVVLEAVREEEAVSYTKGCYVGQEIIARIHWRGRPAKKLAGLVFDGDPGGPPPASGWAARSARDDGREVGRVTSSAYSPALGRFVALGVVKFDQLEPGTELRVYDGDREVSAARVAALPLVRGSWAVAGGAR